MEQERVEALKKTLGANIRKARTRLGITQEQMAELLDISPEVYGRMERGLIFPRVERLVDICAILGEPADRLLGLSTAQAPLGVVRTGTGQDELLPVMRRFLPVMPRLTPAQRLAVRRHLAGLLRLLLAFLDAPPTPPGRRARRGRVPTR